MLRLKENTNSEMLPLLAAKCTSFCACFRVFRARFCFAQAVCALIFSFIPPMIVNSLEMLSCCRKLQWTSQLLCLYFTDDFCHQKHVQNTSEITEALRVR